jgi:peptidoglycan DL-endopeptidase CwlO
MRLVLTQHDTQVTGSRRRTAAVLAVVCLAALALSTAVSGEPAGAEPAQVITATQQPQTRAELFRAADEAQRQIDRLDEQLEITVEQYNGASVRLDEISAELTSIRVDLQRQQSELRQGQELLSQRLVWMYKVGDYTWLDALLSSGSIADAESQVDFFRRLAQQDRKEQESFTRLVDEVEWLERTVAAKRDQALAIEEQIEAERLVVEDRLAEREALLASLDSRIAAILGQRDELSRAEARRLAVNIGDIRGTAAQVAVVTETLRHLGKDYVWAADGPDTFDCSGLVLYVYARFGVHVPHFAAYQADYGRRVAYDDLQPADLVFFGSPIHHVGIYAGNDRFIHAPHTGDVVKVSRLSTYERPSACARYTGLITKLP